MRPNLSLESITGALAVLGAGVIMAACGGEAPKTPVDAKEVPGATDKAATPRQRAANTSARKRKRTQQAGKDGPKVPNGVHVPSAPGSASGPASKRSRGAAKAAGLSLYGMKSITARRSLWDADHILPVAEGGGQCDLDNLRTLCLPCHREVTAQLRLRLRRQV